MEAVTQRTLLVSVCECRYTSKHTCKQRKSGGRAHCVKVFVTKSNDLSLIPRPFPVGQKQLEPSPTTQV